MLILVIGGSGSGKSAYAEDLTIRLSGKMPRYYLATMQARDEESRKRIIRHRKLREGKGFVTVEQPRRIWEALNGMTSGSRQGGTDDGRTGGEQEKLPRCALLECMSNLAANEMFSGEKIGEDEAADQIFQGIVTLNRGLAHLVVVSNNVFEDGMLYDPSTMAYLRLLGKLNRELAKAADRVVEVVAGIPLALKEPERTEGIKWES